MIYKYIILLVTLSMTSGCTFFNVFKGQDYYLSNYYAEELNESIDSSIKNESAKGAARGFVTTQVVF